LGFVSGWARRVFNNSKLTVSHSGSTHETLAATRLAKKAGASTICIANYGKSPIKSYADVLLHTMARET
jgi:DNA-binding MurR/RpiR family transcriptional regulator